MTTITTYDRTAAVAAGTAPIPFDFQAISEDEIAVLRAGVVETGFTVSLNGDGTGSVTPTTSWGTDAIVILSDPNFEQRANFSRFGPFYPDQLNPIFDRLSRSMIALKARVDTLGSDATLRTDLAASGGPGLVAFSQATSYSNGTVGRKLQHLKAPQDYASHAAADALGVPLFVPEDISSTRANGAAMVSPHWGPGQVTTADGNKRGQSFAQLSSRPSRAVIADHDSIETAFKGDWSKNPFAPHEHRITGNTLGQPATGYLYTPEAAAKYVVMYNSSGWNQATGSNDGRTAAVAYRTTVHQYGQGDAVAYNASGSVGGGPMRSGATHFLANPAVVLFNGDINAIGSGGYANPLEYAVNDNGYDISGIGVVLNLNRTNDTGALQCWWAGLRVQSGGSKAINNVLSLVGKANFGVDFTPATFGTNQAAISLAPGQRIYFNNASANGYYTQTVNNDYIQFANSGIEIVIGGNARFRVKAGRVMLPGVAASTSYANDAAAAAGGVAIDELYRNGSVIQARVA